MAIKNYLKNVKDITAPLNWKSAPDSPPTQLAYVTKPEIDLLVKANLHGSMNGKPNKGPKGIMSLDGLGEEDTAYDDAVDKSGNEAAIDNYFSSGQYQSDQNQGINNNTAQDIIQNVANYQNKTGDMTGGNIITSTQNQATAEGIALTPEQAKKIKEEKELAETSETFREKVMKKLMGGGEDGNLSLTPDFKDTLPAGMHPLRKQYEYLKEKYGPNWANTTQAKVLESYLSGVPVERGGGLGARSDETDAELIGPTNVDDIPMYDPVTGKYRSLEERQALADAAQARLNALNQFGGIGSLDAAEGATSTEAFLRSLDPEVLQLGLSPDQYFRFRQQLMAADPTAENQLYKDTFPGSSGAGLGALSRFIPGLGTAQTFLGGMLPERDLTGYQQNIDPIAAAFEQLPVEQSNMGNMINIIRKPNFADKYPDADFGIPEKPKYPFPIRPELPYEGKDPRFPFPVGIASVFDPRFIGPSFRGSPYTNRGVSPAFYKALSRFA